MQFRKFLHLSDSVLHWDLCLPYNRMHICRLCLKVSGLFWCVRNSDRSLKKDTICWLSVIQFQIPHILSSVLCEIRKISVMRLLLKDAGPSSYRIHSDPQPLYEMAWFSQSQISSYWYNLYGCFPDADEASVLSAFVYVYLLFWVGSPFFKFSYLRESFRCARLNCFSSFLIRAVLLIFL